MTKVKETVYPFLRWAGGKRWLLKHLNETLKGKYNNYHEIFLGGGSVFFQLNPPNNSYLADLNPRLIETYTTLRDDIENVIKMLKTFSNTKEDYYVIRETNYENSYEKAAQFIYLNNTSFNGIYRVNRNGKYNVPYGFRKTPFLNEENLLTIHKRLQKVNLTSQDFYEAKKNIHEGDLIFIDPPYTVSHNENGFIAYNEKLFSLEDQYRLSLFIDEIKQAGAKYILTNAAHEKVLEIFKKEDDSILTLERASTIGGTKAKRGQIKEYIFTNTNL